MTSGNEVENLPHHNSNDNNNISNDFNLEPEDSDENNFSTDDRGDDKSNSATNAIKCCFCCFRFCLVILLCFCFSHDVEISSRSRAE